jgi:protein involved in polysaccharide export with SLBB domain
MLKKYKYFVYIVLFNLSFVFSQSMQDLQKLKSEYEKINNKNKQLDGINNNGSFEINNEPKEYQFIVPKKRDNNKSQHFGYDFFTIRDTIKFWENLPSPREYYLGSGDELVITVWGETRLRQSYTITREGKIYDERVGLLNLSGLSISDANSYLKSQFGRIYATLNNPNPTSFIDVSLGTLKSINVNFVGELKLPGVYPIHPFSNLITGLIQAGGIDTTGSLRRININRNNKLLTSIDLYEYFIKGTISSDIQLRDQDVIVVSPRYSTVTIDSAVFRPGKYESLPNETVGDIIKYSGGVKSNASNLFGLHKLKSKKNRTIENNYENNYYSLDEASSIIVNEGDKITVPYLFKEIQEVEIIGQVKVPGKYLFYNNMELLDLLTLAGGFNDSTYIKSIYLDQAEIIRRNPNGRYENVIEVNLLNVINGTSNKKTILQNLDRVVIHANLNFFEKENIFISGEVKVPGSYPITIENESLQSLLDRAGGLTSKALRDGISIYRNKKFFEKDPLNINSINYNNINTSESNLQLKQNQTTDNNIRVAWQKTNISLMPGDSIHVKEKTSTVYVSGAVYNPGVVEFNKNKSLKFYLNSSGGLTMSADRKGIIVLYPNGTIKPKKWYSSPKIKEGSTIIVNNKAIEEPFNITQFATNWSSIISSMVTAIILSQQL